MYSGFPSFKKNPLGDTGPLKLQRSLISGAKELRRLQLAHGHQALHAAQLFGDVARGNWISAAYRTATFPATRKTYKPWKTRFRFKYQRIQPSRAYTYRKRYRYRNLGYLRKYKYRKYKQRRGGYRYIQKKRRNYYRRYTT